MGDEVVDLTIQLRCQVGSTAVESNELAAVHVELEPHNAKADSLDKAIKVSQKEVFTVNDVVPEHKAWLGRCWRLDGRMEEPWQ